MRATTLFPFALLLCGVLLAITLSSASSLPVATPGAAMDAQDASAGLVEPARTYRKRTAKRRGYRRPYYAPYFCARPYQLRYWQYYAPICYPL